MHKIIAVTGPGNSGKTGSIRQFLADRGIVYMRRGDITIVIPIRKAGRTLVVGVASGGDTGAVAERNIRFLTARNCDIIICAAKSKGPTLRSALVSGGSVMPVVIVTNKISRPSQATIVDKNRQIADLIWAEIP